MWWVAAYLSPQVRPLACTHLARLPLAQGALEEAATLIEEGRAAARASADAPAEGLIVLVLTLLEGDPFQDEARARYSQWLASAGRYEDAVPLLQATARQPLTQ